MHVPATPHPDRKRIASPVANILALEREAASTEIAPLNLEMELLELNDLEAFLPEWRKIAEAADSDRLAVVS